jgi:16S rRNA (guanine1207-N2)-methyltransferase
VDSSAPFSADYRVWQNTIVKVAGTSYTVATKQGVFAHGRTDRAASMLAERAATPPAGGLVVQMNCGTGLFGVIAARSASQVVLTDRNVLSVEAAKRTLAANNVHNGTVLACHGAPDLPDAGANIVAIRVPTERLALLQLLLDAFRVLCVGGRCYIAGATSEGIKPATRTLERLFGNMTVLARDSGHRIAVSTKRSESVASTEDLGSAFLDNDSFNELDVTLRGRPFTLFSRPGVFSWDHLDEATAILADVMRVRPADSVLDLGCGCGALGIVAATLSHTGRVCMVDADTEAIRSAKRSAAAARIPGVCILPSDVASAVINERFDVVVTNPPFHVGKATNLDVPLQFIQEAWEVLSPGGRLFLVANRTLPYERAIVQRFGNIANLHDGRAFKVLTATTVP